LINKLSRDLARRGVRSAIRRRDTPALFDWLLETISYQGCGYHKIEQCCAEPDHFRACPLPTHDLRNGRLNQAAYSLFLFMRDVANGDFVGWVDQRLADADLASGPDRATRLRQALVEPLAQVYGVSNKVLSMALAGLLLAGDQRRVLWTETGAVMIVVDTLVHNFLRLTKFSKVCLCAAQRYGPPVKIDLTPTATDCPPSTRLPRARCFDRKPAAPLESCSRPGHYLIKLAHGGPPQ
jgi:hypothetical protein